MSGRESSKESRFQFDASIMFSVYAENPHCFYGARMRSTSESGIYFESNYQLQSGTVLDIRQADYGLDSIKPKSEQSSRVCVVRCKKLMEGSPYEYGVHAENIESESGTDKDEIHSVYPEIGHDMIEILEDAIDCDNPACKSVQKVLHQAKESTESRAKELTTLNRFASAISSTLELKQILKIVCKEMVEIFGSRNAGIGLLSQDRTQLTLVAFHTAHEEEEDATGLVIPIAGNAATVFVIEHGETIIVPDAQHNPITSSYHNIAFLRGTQCIMIVPLLARGEVIGTIGLPTVDPNRVYTPSDVAFAQTIAGQISGAIENARLYEKTEKARDAMERELKIGRDIQYGFFPETLPNITGWEIASHFKSARMVAGDFYDVFRLKKNGTLGLVIADVCGKGVGAALYMALFRTLIRAFAINKLDELTSKEGSSFSQAGDILTHTMGMTNNYISGTHGTANMFASIFLGILEPDTGTLVYINGGHQAPFVIDGNGIKMQLHSTGTLVGVLPNVTFETNHMQMDSEDILFAYTDGLTEAKSQSGEFYGDERLINRVTQPFHSAGEMVNGVLTDINQHIYGTEQYDDITMLAVRRMKELE